MDISLLVCSNRPERLRALLESVCRLAVPAGLSWELLVVDTAAPSSGEVARSFAGRLPIRCVEERRPGLCLARNCGVAEAKGKYLCWTDDDVLLDREWLSAYVEAFRRHPEADLFGGRILPRLEEPASPLFRRHLLEWPLSYLVAHRDLGDDPVPFTPVGGRLPWGANFAARAEAQRRHPYDVELGLSTLHRRSGDETDVAYRILKAGGSGWWVPGARVEHVIPVERQTLDYLSYYYDQAGRTSAFLHDRHPGDNSLASYGLPFARGGRPGLELAAAASRLVSVAAGAVGLGGPRLRFLARHAYYRGIAAHFRDEGKLMPPHASRRDAEALL